MPDEAKNLPAELSFDFRPATPEQTREYCKFMVSNAANMIPKDYHGQPGKMFAAIMAGQPLGFPPLQSLSAFAVINGRPAIWGDALVALVQASGELESLDEDVAGEGDHMTASCVVNRKGQTATYKEEFSVEDAKTAGLWGKTGPWKQYPKRMLRLRARSWALRAAFADKLLGVGVAEEVMDYGPNVANSGVEIELVSSENVTDIFEDETPDETVIESNGTDWHGLLSDYRTILAETPDNEVETIQSGQKQLLLKMECPEDWMQKFAAAYVERAKRKELP
jgi:hypothetical protein